MEGREKAKELVDRFRDKNVMNTLMSPLLAKQCALICVDEIIEAMNNLSADTDTVLNKNTELHFKDWQEVKAEIEKL